jgi:hypothetical protein
MCCVACVASSSWSIGRISRMSVLSNIISWILAIRRKGVCVGLCYVLCCVLRVRMGLFVDCCSPKKMQRGEVQDYASSSTIATKALVDIVWLVFFFCLDEFSLKRPNLTVRCKLRASQTT